MDVQEVLEKVRDPLAGVEGVFTRMRGGLRGWDGDAQDGMSSTTSHFFWRPLSVVHFYSVLTLALPFTFLSFLENSILFYFYPYFILKQTI
jgi:hypothetical protein